MPHDPIQGQGQGPGHGGPKVAKMNVEFQSLPTPPKAPMHACNQKLTLNCDTPRQYGDIFLIFILVQRHVTFKLRVFHVRQTNFAPYEESTGGPVRGLFFIKINVSLNSKRNHRRQHHCIVINGGGWSGKKDHCGFNGIRH